MECHACCITRLLALHPLWAASIPAPFVDASDLISVIFGVIDICFVWPGLLFAAAAALSVRTPSTPAQKKGDFYFFGGGGV